MPSGGASGAIVIGYGNRLRGDDGVGSRVAAAIGRRRPDVRALGVHRLTPELAALVAEADVAVVVDARVDEGDAVEIERVVASDVTTSLGHVMSPGTVLAVASALYGRCPLAWIVRVPVAAPGFGDALSPRARAAAAGAVAAVERLVPPLVEHAGA